MKIRSPEANHSVADRMVATTLLRVEVDLRWMKEYFLKELF
jgi:hypothetical protein